MLIIQYVLVSILFQRESGIYYLFPVHAMPESPLRGDTFPANLNLFT